MILDYTKAKTQLPLVPSQIRNWFGSEEVVKTIGELNDKFKLEGNKYAVIARLLLKLETNITPVDQFLFELTQGTELDQDKASSLAGEITKKILLPIKEDLKKYGIDIAPLEKLLPAGSQEKNTISSSRIPVTIETTPSHPSLSTPPPPALKSFARPSGSEQFFKGEATPPTAPKAPEETPKASDIGPIIIHQETKAESLNTSPKLGFRVGENKLTDAKDRPAPLQSAELTMANVPGAKKSDEEVKPVTPVVPLGLKLSMGKGTAEASKTTPSQTAPLPGGIFGKIKNVFSKEDVTIEKKLEVPLPPPPPPGATTPSVTQKTTLTPTPTANFPVKISIEKTNGVGISPSILPDAKKDQPISSPLPNIEKVTKTEPFTPKIVPASSLTPAPTTPVSPASPKETPTITQPSVAQALSSKVDLKKISDITPGVIPPSPAKKKDGIFSRWFKKSESNQKIIIPAEPRKIDTAPAPEKKNALPQNPTPTSPLPPKPPAPPKTPELPKAITESVSQPLPAQKVSPLSNFREDQSKPTLTPTLAKTVDTISATPKIVNYSEYPTEEKKQA